MTDILLKIIEEFADGFLIVNEHGRVLFFNDVLLRDTGLRSSDILDSESEFLSALGINGGRVEDHDSEIAGHDGHLRRVRVSALPVESEKGEYCLVRVKNIPDVAVPGGRPWSDLFANLGDPLLAVDLSGNIQCANPSFYRLVGYAEGESLPNIAQLYVHSAELEDKILRLAESGAVNNLETHLCSRANGALRVLDTAWAVKDGKGQITGYTSHFKDVTYVKNLEARLKISERNYIVLFDTILSSIIIVDPVGKILNCNYYAEQLYGYSWTEITGSDFSEVFRTTRKEAPIQQILSQVAARGGRHIETDVPRRCRDGTVKFTYASYTALTSTLGETIAYSIMERDLTERVRLEKKLQESFIKIKNTQSAAILGFARLTEYRDKSTGKHLERIREYTRVLATGLSRLPKYADYISPGYIEDLCLSSILHDVGKVGIEDAILLKPGKLDLKEFERIKEHARLGGEALRVVDNEIREESFLTIGKEIAFHHHERWDGTGYPDGLKGEGIPLSARIVALADVYDALTSTRTYKESLSHEEALSIIEAERATHFDPDVVDMFLENQEVFSRIRLFESFREHPESIDDILDRKPKRKG